MYHKLTLLTLHNDCLTNIFQFLKLDDLIKLHKTCHRLRDVCASYCALKYKNIVVETDRFDCEFNAKMSKQEFRNAFSVIGKHVLTIRIEYVDPFILQTIEDYCKNLNSVEMWKCEKSRQLLKFKNLKELKLNNVNMSSNAWRNCFKSNRDLESLECSSCNEENFIKLLKILPKLKSLEGLYLRNQDSRHLLRLEGLTKFSFGSSTNCNQLLNELAKRLNLAELKIMMIFDIDTFAIIKSFRNLESLTIINYSHDWQESWFSDATMFPPKLKRLVVAKIKISCTIFLSLVKHLKFLKEFDVGSGNIYLDLGKSIVLGDSKLNKRLEEELRMERSQRTLKIIYFDQRSRDKKFLIYHSFNLKITNAPIAHLHQRLPYIAVSLPEYNNLPGYPFLSNVDFSSD